MLFLDNVVTAAVDIWRKYIPFLTINAKKDLQYWNVGNVKIYVDYMLGKN